MTEYITSQLYDIHTNGHCLPTLLRLPHLNGYGHQEQLRHAMFSTNHFILMRGEKAMHVVLQNNEKIQVKI